MKEEENLNQNTKKKNDKNFDKVSNLIKDLKNKNLKLLADMENLRKIQQEENKEFEKYALSSFLKDLIPLIDMISNTLAIKNVSEDVKNWLKGFEMINQNIENLFISYGVNKIEVEENDDFDSEFHSAISSEFSDEIEKGKIIKIMQTGYKLHDRLLRPTMVIVSKGKKEKTVDNQENKTEEEDSKQKDINN